MYVVLLSFMEIMEKVMFYFFVLNTKNQNNTKFSMVTLLF